MTSLRQARNHPWTVLGIVAFALFMDYFIYGILVPLGPYSPAKTVSESQLGTIFAGYAVGVFLSTPFFGYLGDRLGCRRPMIIGVLLTALSALLFCFGAHFYLAVLARFLQGAAAAATWTAGLALIAEHYVEKRVQMMGLAMVGSTAGSVAGPLAGGWLFDLGGYQLPFALIGLLIVVDASLRILLLPDEKGSTEKGPDLRALLCDKSILVAGLAVAIAAAGWGIIEPLVPNRLRAVGATPGVVGMLFTVSSIFYGLAAPIVSRVSERFSIRFTICGGIVAMAATLPLLALSNNIFVNGLCLCLVNISYAFVLNPTSAELGNAVDRRGLNCYAAVYAVYNITYSFGMMGADAFALSAGENLSFLQILLCMSGSLLLCIPFILKGVQGTPQISQEENAQS